MTYTDLVSIVSMKTKRAYKYRFYPTPEQAELLARTFGCVRFVYNAILKWRTDAFYNDGESVNYNTASAKLTALKKEFEWLNDVSSVPLQQSLRHQQTAFKNFWKVGRNTPPSKRKTTGSQLRSPAQLLVTRLARCSSPKTKIH